MTDVPPAMIIPLDKEQADRAYVSNTAMAGVVVALFVAVAVFAWIISVIEQRTLDRISKLEKRIEELSAKQ